MDAVAIRRLDITSLLLFAALMKHRQATRAAEEFGLSQSAVSHALKRLRIVFDDELFLRRPHGLEPTAKAKALEAEIGAALAALHRALAPPLPFDPDRGGVLRLAGTERALSIAVPPLLAAISDEAPNVTVDLAEMLPETARSALEEGSIDLALGHGQQAAGPRFHLDPLIEDSMIVVARRGHELFDGSMTLGRFCHSPHVLWTDGQGSDPIGAALSARGLSRRIALQTSLLLPALRTLQQSRLIAVLPRHAVQPHLDGMGLQYALPPLHLAPVSLGALRHARENANPLIDWAVARMTTALR